jgi:hypothetical protein
MQLCQPRWTSGISVKRKSLTFHYLDLLTRSTTNRPTSHEIEGNIDITNVESLHLWSEVQANKEVMDRRRRLPLYHQLIQPTGPTAGQLQYPNLGRLVLRLYLSKSDTLAIYRSAGRLHGLRSFRSCEEPSEYQDSLRRDGDGRIGMSSGPWTGVCRRTRDLGVTAVFLGHKCVGYELGFRYDYVCD